MEDFKKNITNSKEIKSLFLGPNAENQELYESLILEIIKDSCFLRKNFHPDDLPVISEKDKLSEVFQFTSAELKQELQKILAELKKGVPLYHPRYIGHMHGDVLIPAIIAYFGTMLYNSNNVAGESSPATTRMEFEYISQLAQMVGFNPMRNVKNDKDQSWGHLCSGGTSANIEALWVVRNMKYYPIALKLSSLEKEDCYFIGDFQNNFSNKMIKEMSFLELFNLPSSTILELKDFLYKKCGENFETITKLIGEYEVTYLGVYGIHQKVFELSKEVLELPNLYYAKSYHYSWEKAIDILGIGHKQIIQIPLDKSYRMDYTQFKEIYKKDSPTLAVIGILGSSKQGSIDPIDDLVQFRNDLEQSEKKSFYLHIDGAYGGFFPCLIRNNHNSEISYCELKNNLQSDLADKSELSIQINEKWHQKVSHVKYADSITIDPHKMGYVPYPAGSIIYSDSRYKDFISYLPSYLNKPTDSNDISEEFLGQWTLEGSRPGAAAAACYLSAKVLPFHKDAHGLLIRNSIMAANMFWKTIQNFNSDVTINQGFKIVTTYIPESNIISYVFTLPSVIKKVEYLNILTLNLYKQFSVHSNSIIPTLNFMVAKEDFEYEDIEHTNLLTECSITEHPNSKDKINLFSSVFMNPLSIYIKEEGFYDKFWEEMKKHAENIIPEIVLKIITDKNQKRLNILWVEDDNEIDKMNSMLQHDINVGRFLNIDFKNTFNDASRALENENSHYDIFILDLNLKNNDHTNITNDKIGLTLKILDLIGNDKHNKVLYFSKFFANIETRELALDALKNKTKFKDYQIIEKNGIDADVTKIIKGIYSVLTT